MSADDDESCDGRKTSARCSPRGFAPQRCALDGTVAVYFEAWMQTAPVSRAG